MTEAMCKESRQNRENLSIILDRSGSSHHAIESPAQLPRRGLYLGQLLPDGSRYGDEAIKGLRGGCRLRAGLL